jgi:ABC-type dipeptide/oligopeptide/nickel transport system permease component
MTIELIESLLVIFIVILQVIIFFGTKRQIRKFKNAIPETSSLKVARIFVKRDELENCPVGEIAANVPYYPTIQTEENPHAQEVMVINDETDKKSGVFEKIIHSINTYLIRNRNSASDFNLIKDITERNLDAVEEEINLTLSIPLYLGLMGTMLGIVIGLFSMSSLTLTGRSGVDDLGQGITILLGGVKIAMIASFMGLLLTTLNSGWFYKGSKSRVEAKKNEFYTFIQTELLPVVNQSLSSTFESFQRNLAKFNEELTGNLGNLAGIFDTNSDSLKRQEKILSDISKLDIATVAQYNVNVLKELQVSMEEFEKFNKHFASINLYVENSTQMAERFNELLQRTDDFQEIAANVNGNLTESRELLDFLSAHFKVLEEYKNRTSESIAEAGFSITDTFSQLREHIENSSKAVREFTVEELELLKKALEESKTNLGNLQFLETINSDVSLLKDSTASQAERLRILLQEVNKNLETSINTLISIKHIGVSLEKRGVRNYLKQLFGNNNGE